MHTDILTKRFRQKKYLYPEAYEHWKSLKKFIDQTWPANYLQAEHDLDNYDLGKDKPLRCYRRWCLELKLYINPLNDLAAYNITCRAVLQLPLMTVKVGDHRNIIPYLTRLNRNMLLRVSCFTKEHSRINHIMLIKISAWQILWKMPNIPFLWKR